MELVGKIHGQIRIQSVYVRLLELDSAQQEGKGMGAHTSLSDPRSRKGKGRRGEEIRAQIAYNRVWGARSRTARREEKGRGGRTWWVLVAGDRPGEDLAKGGASRPAVGGGCCAVWEVRWGWELGIGFVG